MPSITARRPHWQETSTSRSKVAASPNVSNGNSRCALLAFIGRAPYRSAAKIPIPVASPTAAQAERASPILSRCTAGNCGGGASTLQALKAVARHATRRRLRPDVSVCQFGVMFFLNKRASFNECFHVLTPGGEGRQAVVLRLTGFLCKG